MPQQAKKPSRVPSKDELLAFIQGQPGGMGKREIMRAFGVKGADRLDMKRLLGELEEEGAIEKGGKRFSDRPERDGLPSVTLLEAGELDADGELTARPANWTGTEAPPKIVLAPASRRDPALGPGDRFLGRLSLLDGDERYAYQAKVIKKLGKSARRVLGVYRELSSGGRILPVAKKADEEYVVDKPDAKGAQDGELVEAEVLPAARYGLKKARVLDRIGDAMAPKAFSLIAMREQGIALDFPPEAMAEADAAELVAALGDRKDLRDLPLVTIDPADARDHDDAVYAAPDPDPANPGGFVLWVAIADVAHYVRPGSALDAAAQDRGNSAYFPDRVAPMLPERLSADLCSLMDGVDRPCLAAEIRITSEGALLGAEFHRALMRSIASLTYEQAQAAWEGEADEATEPLLETVVQPLFAAYHALGRAREKRDPLDLELPERQVVLDAEGAVASIQFRDRFEAHKLIEEFMILANVAAAEALEAKRGRFLYRVHEEPSPAKIDALREVLAGVGVPLAKGQVMTTKLLNRALDQAAETEHAELANMSVLRAQTQAYYGPENFGHFGLALRSYAHFTSPIRRYADLLLHRALISSFRLPGWETDGQTDAEREGMAATATHISATERRAMTAERDTIDRYLAAYLSERAGGQFEGRISGVQRFGLFVKLDETGADGFIPIASLGDEYFRFDEGRARLIGERSGVELSMGQTVKVRLLEATPETGGMIFELLDLPAARRGRGGGRRGGRAEASGKGSARSDGGERRAGRGKIAAAKRARSAKRAPSGRKRR